MDSPKPEGSLDLNQRARDTEQYWMPYWTIAAFENWRTIMRLNEERRTITMASLHNSIRKPAIVLGSGVSLDDALPLLRDWEGILVAGASQAATCVYHGRQPDYIVAYDSMTPPDFLCLNHVKYTAPLVTHPTMGPPLVEAWPGQFAFFVSMPRRIPAPLTAEELDKPVSYFSEKYGALPLKWLVWDEHMSFMTQTIVRAYVATRMIDGALYECGSTSNLSASFAHFIGCDPIFLVGVDYCFLKDRSRFQGWVNNTGEWEPQPIPPIPEPAVKAHELTKDGKLTTEEMVSYKGTLLYQSIGPKVHFIEASTPGNYGALEVLPKADVLDVIANQGQGFDHLRLSQKDRIAVVQEYFRSINRPDIIIEVPEGQEEKE